MTEIERKIIDHIKNNKAIEWDCKCGKTYYILEEKRDKDYIYYYCPHCNEKFNYIHNYNKLEELLSKENEE